MSVVLPVATKESARALQMQRAIKTNAGARGIRLRRWILIFLPFANLTEKLALYFWRLAVNLSDLRTELWRGNPLPGRGGRKNQQEGCRKGHGRIRWLGFITFMFSFGITPANVAWTS